jgi:hypothetical protein
MQNNKRKVLIVERTGETFALSFNPLILKIAKFHVHIGESHCKKALIFAAYFIYLFNICLSIYLFIVRFLQPSWFPGLVSPSMHLTMSPTMHYTLIGLGREKSEANAATVLWSKPGKGGRQSMGSNNG